ncbi:MAG: MBL fold metallo-hydrolase [Alphaproteobacteria bacterium]
MPLALTFLGTCGNVERRTRRHRRHSALLISGGAGPVMIDCGLDWLGRFEALKPRAILITHAHPDHAFGLKDGAPCPVFGTSGCLGALADYPLKDRRVLAPRKPAKVAGLMVEAFPVVHSLRAPAVGFRVAGKGCTLFYVPDVVAILEPEAALSRLDLFIGDGATMTRPMVRRREGRLFGHTTVRAQLGWCRKAGVRRAVFTHCGSEIVDGDERRLGAKLRAMARECGVEARFAYDGLTMTVP